MALLPPLKLVDENLLVQQEAWSLLPFVRAFEVKLTLKNFEGLHCLFLKVAVEMRMSCLI